MHIFIPNIGGADVNSSAITDILAPTREDSPVHHLSNPQDSPHRNQSFP